MFVHNPRAKPINSPDNGGGDEKKRHKNRGYQNQLSDKLGLAKNYDIHILRTYF